MNSNNISETSPKKTQSKIHSKKQTLKQIALGVTMGITGFAIIEGSTNFILHSNAHRNSGNPPSHYFQKVDGLESYTEICIRPENRTEMSKNSIFSINSFIDSNGNGLIDSISYNNSFISDSLTSLSKLVGIKPSSNSLPAILYRNNDFDTHPNLFRDADKELKYEMERFNNFIKEYLPNR